MGASTQIYNYLIWCNNHKSNKIRGTFFVRKITLKIKYVRKWERFLSSQLNESKVKEETEEDKLREKSHESSHTRTLTQAKSYYNYYQPLVGSWNGGKYHPIIFFLLLFLVCSLKVIILPSSHHINAHPTAYILVRVNPYKRSLIVCVFYV